MPSSPDGIIEADAILEADVHVVELFPSRSCDTMSNEEYFNKLMIKSIDNFTMYF